MAKTNETWQIVVDFNRPDLTNATFGIDQGIMYLTTGQDFTYDGKLHKGDLLTRDGIPSHYRYIDVQKSGGYASFSTIAVKISIATGLNVYLKENNVITRGARVFMSVSYDRGPKEVVWVGKVNESPTSRKTITFVCADEFNAIHSDQPSEAIKEDDPTSESQEVKPLVIGNVSQADLVFEGRKGNINFDVESGNPTAVEGGVKIIGFPASTLHQARWSSGRYFAPISWSRVTLYCGTNQLNQDELTDYVLTFNDEVTKRVFFANIISSSATYKVAERYVNYNTNEPVYGVDVVLDKAINLEMEYLEDDALSWDFFDPTNENLSGVPRDTSQETNSFFKYGNYFVNGVGTPSQRNGITVHWGGREWVLKDHDNYDPSLLMKDNALYPLNVPAEFPYDTYPNFNLLIPQGYAQWIPGQRIKQAGFNPMKFSVTPLGSTESTVEAMYQSQAPYSEPIHWAERKNEGLDLSPFPVLDAPYNSFIYSEEDTTLATLRHKDQIATFLAGVNSAEVSTVPESEVFTDDDQRVERLFLVSEGKATLENPEWVQRIADLGDSDITKKVPIARSYKRSSASSDLQAFVRYTMSGNGYNNDDRKQQVNLNGYPTLEGTEGSVFDYYGQELLSYDNAGNNWQGLTFEYQANPSSFGSQVGYTPRQYYLGDMKNSFPNVKGYKRNHMLELLQMYLPNTGDKHEINFMGRILFNKWYNGTDAFGNDTISFEMRIVGYEGAVGDSTDQVYDSGNFSLYSAEVSTDFWDSMETTTLVLKLGSLTHDITPDNFPNLLFIPAQIPQDIRSNMAGDWFNIQIRFRIESTDDMGMGFYPSYFSMIEWKDNTDTNYTEVSRFPNRNMSYANGVWGVLNDFDNAIEYFGNSDLDECDSIMGPGGGGVPLIGEQFLEPENTFNICKRYAEKGFFAITTDNQGRRFLKPWFAVKTPVAQFATDLAGDRLNIVEGSLTELKSTPYSMIYTRGIIRYDANNNGQTQHFVKIDRTEEEEFPTQEEYTQQDDVSEARTALITRLSDSNRLLKFAPTTIPASWGTGSILECTPQLVNQPTLISIVAIDTVNGIVYAEEPFNEVPNVSVSIGRSADFLKVSGVLTWQTFVSSSENISYADAQELWQGFRDAYLRRGGHNDIPSFLAKAPELLSSGGGGNVLEYLRNIVLWNTFTKETATFRTSVLNVQGIEHLDCITVRDSVLTLGLDRICWPYGIKFITRDGVVELEVIFDKDPYDPVTPRLDIDETWDVDDEIDEVIDEGTGGLPVDDIDEE